MTGSGHTSGEAFALERLRENPELDYAALRRAADAAGVSLQPIQYGRARRQLGLTAPAAKPIASAAAASDRDEPAAAAADGGADEPAAVRAPAATPPARRGKGSPAFDFLVAELRDDQHLSYAELRQRAEARGFRIAPIMYGRAKAILGLVPVRPRGSGKAVERKASGGSGKVKAAAIPTAAPASPRTLKQVESVAADRFLRQLEHARSTDDLLAAVKQLDAERRRLRALLEQIADTIDEALGYADE